MPAAKELTDLRRRIEESATALHAVTKQLHHAVLCFDPDCAACLLTEQQLEDGPVFFQAATDTPARREAISRAFTLLARQADLIADALEVSSLPIPMRRSSVDLAHKIRMLDDLINRPMTKRARPSRRQAVTPATLLPVDSGKPRGEKP